MDDTKNNDCSLAAFAIAIAGNWINPLTNNKYIFTPDPIDGAKGEVSIVQNGVTVPIPLSIALRNEAGSIHVVVENASYPVTFLQEPEPTLIIEVEPVGRIRLVKTG